MYNVFEDSDSTLKSTKLKLSQPWLRHSETVLDIQKCRLDIGEH